MSQGNLDLAALVSSRMCYDLIAPIGAINNGLELLSISGQALDGPEMSLIGESINNASARIRFFLIAYGATSEHKIGRAEMVAVLKDLIDSGRLSAGCDSLETQPRKAVPLAFFLRSNACKQLCPMANGLRTHAVASNGKSMVKKRNLTSSTIYGQL